MPVDDARALDEAEGGKHANTLQPAVRTSTNREGSVDHRIEVSDSWKDPQWDAFLAAAPGGHHVQTSIWGQLKAAEGWEPTRVIIRRNSGILAGAQLLLRRIPAFGAIAYVPKGPVIGAGAEALGPVAIAALEDAARERRVRHLTVQPPNDGETLVQPLSDVGFRPSDTPVAPVATVQVDLEPDHDEILARMKKNHRRYIRYGLRQGVTGRLGTEADLESFHRLVLATSARQGFATHTLDHFVEMWDLFRPHGLIQLFLAEYEGRLVSGQLGIAFGDRVIAKNSGWTGEHGSLGPNHVMEWTTMRWAKEHGYRYYDLEGIDLRVARLVTAGRPLPEHLRRTHSFYKLGFGGEVALFPGAQVLVPNSLLRWGYWSVYPRLAGMKSLNKAVNRVRVRGK